jgi:hypothetical protein
MKTFVQTDRGEFPKEMYLTYAYGAAKYFGYEVVKFEPDDFTGMKKECPVFCGVNQFPLILKHLGVDYTPLISYPDRVRGYLNRKVELIQLQEAKARVLSGESLFIKPTDENRKSFNGQLVSGEWPKRDFQLFKALERNLEVFVSEPIEFKVEYRVFIHRGKILDSRKYRGDFRLNIDYEIVERAIKDFGGPVAYCLDFGLDSLGRTTLVEVTDANSLGHYGLDPFYFSNMIIDRWNEIVYEQWS